MEQLATEKRVKNQYIVFSAFLASPQCAYTLTNPPKQDRPKTARSVSDQRGTANLQERRKNHSKQ